MKLGIVSDTHMPYKGNVLPRALVDGLQGVDLILHAGDFTDPAVIGILEEIAPVEAVTGNNDGEEIYERFGRKKMLTLAGFRVGLIHGDGFHKTTEERAIDAFRDDRPDLIIFGHSHIPLHRMEEGIMMFNPGSPTDKRRQPRFSFGLIELGKSITAEHVFFDGKL
jgi:putative phosphoesterase